MNNDTTALWRDARFRKSSFSGDNGGNCVEVAWRKSSFSGGNGGDCVEVAWRKSSFSAGNGGECVEVARTDTWFGIRDSKYADGPVLTLTEKSAGAFLTAVRRT